MLLYNTYTSLSTCIKRIMQGNHILLLYIFIEFLLFFTTISDSCCLSYSSVGSDCMTLAYGLFNRLHGKLVVEFKVWFWTEMKMSSLQFLSCLHCQLKKRSLVYLFILMYHYDVPLWCSIKCTQDKKMCFIMKNICHIVNKFVINDYKWLYDDI